jgi:8-oxo-dGTP pyrophosphatase MutT (NUDIX family)
MKLSYRYRTCEVPLCLLRLLKGRMRWVRAAGCVLTDEGGDMLLIRRNGRWDLPKGNVEPGESLRQGAMREVLEETGIAAECACGAVPVKTYHLFNLYGGWHLKQTSWFALRGHTGDPFKPQMEEGVTAVEWVSRERWRTLLSRSYATMDVLSQQISAE